MTYRLLADAVLLGHLGFILFVLGGGLLVRRWRWVAGLHLPCAAYGAAIEQWGWTCPLTPLENRLRALGGEPGHASGFVEHYLVPIVYPEPLSPGAPYVLAVAVVAANGAAYAWALRRCRGREGAGDPGRRGTPHPRPRRGRAGFLAWARGADAVRGKGEP